MGLLSWLRGDRADGSSSSAPDGSSTASASSGAAAGWRELPPVQRTLTAPGLVTDPDGFRGSLGTWQDATLSTPLGHLVSPQAPSGLVHGLVASSGPTTVSRQVEGGQGEDSRDEGSRREGMVASWPSAEGRVQVHPRAVPLQRSASEGQETMVSAGPLPDGLPVRRLVGERPVESALPAPPVPPAPPAPPPSAVPVRDSAPTSSGPPTGPVPAPVQRFTAPQPLSRPHPPGLGAPLAGLPPTAQREIAARTSGPMTEPGGPESPPDTDTPVDTPAVTPVDTPPDTPTGPLLGDAPPLVQHHPHQHVQRARESEPERPAAPASGGVPVPVQRFDAPHALPRLPEPASGPVVPLLAQRAVPLFATGPDAPMAPAPRGATPEPPAVPVRWSAPGPEAAVQRSYAAGQVTVAREAVGTGTGAAAGTAPASLGAAPGPVPPRTAQRHALGSPPVPRSVSSGTTASSPAFRDAGSVAVAAGVAQRMTDGSVVFGGAHVVQRAAESSEPPPPDPLPEAEAEPQPEPDPGLDTDPAFPDAADGGAPGGAESATAGSPGRGTGTPPVTDELVRALYAPLSRLLKADLRLERERAGFLINTRH